MKRWEISQYFQDLTRNIILIYKIVKKLIPKISNLINPPPSDMLSTIPSTYNNFNHLFCTFESKLKKSS